MILKSRNPQIPARLLIARFQIEGHDEGVGERFRGEARAMAALRHPGVAAVYDYSETSLPHGLVH